MNEWISIKDRLPEEDIEISVTIQCEHKEDGISRWVEYRHKYDYNLKQWVYYDEEDDRYYVHTYPNEKVIAWTYELKPYMGE